MKQMSSPIVFFGSGPVAASSLALLAQDFTIEAVVTKPTTTTEMTAVAGGAPVHAVSTKKELDALIATNPFHSQLAVLIDFGIIVSQDVIDYFPLGIVNSHFSLLPELRGADPISFSILSGQAETGVSLMLLTAGMDEGPILAQAPLVLDQTETNPTLTAELIDISHALLKEVLPRYETDEVQPMPQTNEITPTYSRKLTKQDGIIDWTKSAVQIERDIRAFIDWPKSRTTIAGKDVVILAANVVNQQGSAGTIIADGKQLIAYCGEDALSINVLKPAGKNQMTAAAFLAGHRHLIEQ